MLALWAPLAGCLLSACLPACQQGRQDPHAPDPLGASCLHCLSNGHGACDTASVHLPAGPQVWPRPRERHARRRTCHGADGQGGPYHAGRGHRRWAHRPAAELLSAGLGWAALGWGALRRAGQLPRLACLRTRAPCHAAAVPCLSLIRTSGGVPLCRWCGTAVRPPQHPPAGEDAAPAGRARGQPPLAAPLPELVTTALRCRPHRRQQADDRGAAAVGAAVCSRHRRGTDAAGSSVCALHWPTHPSRCSIVGRRKHSR